MVLLLFAGLVSSLLWLSVGFERKTYDLYAVYIYESVSGLSVDSPVKFNGVHVGSVKEVDLNPSDPQQIKLILQIEEGTPITISTHATLAIQGITGGTYLGLSATSSSLEPIPKLAGEQYPVIPYKASFFSRLEKNIADVSKGVKRVFDKENAMMIKKSLENLQSVTATIANNNNSINESLKEIPQVIKDLKKSINEFTATTAHIADASKQVTATMKAGEISINKFTQQTVPPATMLLHRLDSVAANLEKISNQMRQNPSVIVRGSAPAKPGPGE